MSRLFLVLVSLHAILVTSTDALATPDHSQKEIVVGKNSRIKSIKEGIQLAKNGDRLVIKGGVYAEGNIVIDKSITIIGEGQPEIDGQNRFEVFTVRASYVTLKGLVIKNAGISSIHDNAAIRIDEVSNCTIENNRFVHNFFTIYSAKASDCLLKDNEIIGYDSAESSSGNGIHLWDCRNIVISGNRVSGQRDGIYLEFSRNVVIRDNHSEKNLRYGLHFMFSDSCKYFNNQFINNGAGVAVMYSRFVEMKGNRFESNWGPASFGLLLKDIKDSRITENYLYKNTVGIYSEGSTKVTVDKNTFIRNGLAVKLMASSTDSHFTGNNFMGNSFDVATNSSHSLNYFESNYWDNYKGYDLNKDGIGDIPFLPVRLYSMIIADYPPALILLRSFFIDILDMAERAFPALTPETLVDKKPLMRRVT